MTGHEDAAGRVVPPFGTARSAQVDVYRLQVWPARWGRRYGCRVQLFDANATPLLRRPGGPRRMGLWRRTYEGAVHAGIGAAYDVHAVMADVEAWLVVWLDDATVVGDRFLTRLDDLIEGGAA